MRKGGFYKTNKHSPMLERLLYRDVRVTNKGTLRRYFKWEYLHGSYRTVYRSSTTKHRTTKRLSLLRPKYV